MDKDEGASRRVVVGGPLSAERKGVCLSRRVGSGRIGK